MERELRPHAQEWEDARWFPNEVFTRMAELGYLGLKYPEEHGGQGGDYLHDAVLARGAGRRRVRRAGSAGIGAHTGIATPPIWKFGTEDQKRRFLEPAIRGEKIAALGITEPDAGSDVAGHSHLRPQGRTAAGWSTASKTFITNGVRADFVVTAVKTTEEGGHQGLSFLVDGEGHGGVLRVASKLEKIGWHASDTAELAFDDVFVPEENLLGEENSGFYLIDRQLPVGAAAHVARRGGLDGADARARPWRYEASAARSAARSASSRRSGTSSPRWR